MKPQQKPLKPLRKSIAEVRARLLNDKSTRIGRLHAELQEFELTHIGYLFDNEFDAFVDAELRECEKLGLKDSDYV